jgi:hypothetical protein
MQCIGVVDLPGGAVEDGGRLGGGAEGRRERLFRGGGAAAACTGGSLHLARTRARRQESQCQSNLTHLAGPGPAAAAAMATHELGVAGRGWRPEAAAVLDVL